MEPGGYIITKKESENISKSLFKINSDIKKSVEEFRKNSTGLWKEYQDKIKNGVDKVDAFYSVMKF